MSSRRLKRIGLDKQLLDRLVRHNITESKHVLAKTPLELMKLAASSKGCIDDLFLQVSKATCPQSTTAGAIWRENKASKTAFLPTSLSRLDGVLHGGLPTTTITEVAGPSGCGKTQFCLMLSVQATLPVHSGGLGGSVLYIDTESAFSAERLVEIAQTRYKEIYKSEQSVEQLSKSIHVYPESTCAGLLKRLENLEEILIEKNIKLLIIDSIASLVRKEFDSRSGKNLIERTNLLSKQAAILKYIAETFKVPVLVSNQITTRFGSKCPMEKEQGESCAGEAILDGVDGEGYATAALGNTWSHCVNTRLILQYMEGQCRQILVAKSPVSPFAMFIYTIKAEGIVLQDESGDCYSGTDPGLQKIRVRTSLPLHAFM